MTTGFVQAYARLISQVSQTKYDSDDSSIFWRDDQPVVPSDDDDNFKEESPKKKKSSSLSKSYRNFVWKTWFHGDKDYL